MKILFYGEDESMRHMAESLTNVEALHCVDFKEAQSTLQEWDQERGGEFEAIISILDLGLGVKQLDKFAKKTKKIKGHYRCVYAYAQDLEELKSYQKTKWACDGQLLGPISLEGLQEVVSDFETVYLLDKLDDEDVELTVLESQAAKDLENLNEDKEDYDTTQPEVVLPKEFQKSSPDGDGPAVFHENPTHKKIQETFDHVFKYAKKSGPMKSSEDLALPEDDTDVEVSSKSEAPMEESKEEEIDLEFDMPDEEDEGESLEELREVRPSQSSSEKEGHEKKDNNDSEDDGLDFDFSFDDEEDEEGEEDEQAASSGESTAELLADEAATDKEDSSSEDEGFEFDMDDSDEVDGPASDEVSDEGPSADLDLGSDEEDGLSFELGGASESDESDDAVEQQEVEDSPGQLEFDEEEDLQVSEDDQSNDVMAAAEDDFSDLDLSEDPEDDGDIDATKLDTSSLVQEGGESTQDKVDQTISEIVMGESETQEPKQASDDSTGDFDLPEGLPSELTDDMMSEGQTDSQEAFRVDEWSDDELSEDDVGEDTNPTVVTSGHELQKEEQEGKDDKEPASFEPSDDEEDFEFGSVESDSAAPEEGRKNLVQEKQDSPQAVKGEEVEELVPRGLSAYAEDELTRLQSTIRQLREEREENHRQIQELKKEGRLIEQEGLSEKAELDELKIEISILKKRHKNEVEELRYQLKLAEEKKQIYEERCRNYQKEFDRLNQKVRIEFNQVKQREKELESQLELVTMDTEAQVQSRDNKILELKRKIDSFEFNMENASIREQKSREDKARLEERLTKIMSTLRGSIQLLEDEDDSTGKGVGEDTDEKI